MTDERFSPYAEESNLVRARRVLATAPESPSRSHSWDHEPDHRPGVSVIILNLDRPDLIVPLTEQLFDQAKAFRDRGLTFEIWIGDTGSADAEVLAAYEGWQDQVVVTKNLVYHFSRCNNQLARRAHADTLLFLNNDVILPPRPEALLEMFEALHSSPEVGILGAVMYSPDGRIQHCGVDFFRRSPRLGFPFHSRARAKIPHSDLPGSFESPATTGSFLLIRRDLFDSIGGFPHDYAVECQDIDLCLRAHRKGFNTRVFNLGETVHLENATRPKGDECWPDRRLFLRRWRSYVGAHFL